MPERFPLRRSVTKKERARARERERARERHVERESERGQERERKKDRSRVRNLFMEAHAEPERFPFRRNLLIPPGPDLGFRVSGKDRARYGGETGSEPAAGGGLGSRRRGGDQWVRHFPQGSCTMGRCRVGIAERPSTQWPSQSAPPSTATSSFRPDLLSCFKLRVSGSKF